MAIVVGVWVFLAQRRTLNQGNYNSITTSQLEKTSAKSSLVCLRRRILLTVIDVLTGGGCTWLVCFDLPGFCWRFDVFWCNEFSKNFIAKLQIKTIANVIINVQQKSFQKTVCGIILCASVSCTQQQTLQQVVAGFYNLRQLKRFIKTVSNFCVLLWLLWSKSAVVPVIW